MKKSSKVIEDSEKFLAHNYAPLPFVSSSGLGAWYWDVDGDQYLDMLSGYSATNLGIRHPRIVEAAKRQIDRLPTDPRCFYNDVRAEFARVITKFCGMDRVLPKVTGTEAVEAAILIARKWGYVVKGGVKKDQVEIISCYDNFHGRTMGSRSMSTTQEYRDLFGPLAPGFAWIPFGDPDALGRKIRKNTVAFFVEPVQGEGGINVPPQGYLREVEKICRKYNVLLVVDEIQTGFGRTGRDFAFQHEDIKPDLLIIGKALGGGIIPSSAVLGLNRVMDVITPGDDGSTFGGNPLACAIGIEVVALLKEERLSERAAEMGEYFLYCLKKIKSPLIKEVRGKGLLMGIEVVEEAGPARRFCEELVRAGILCNDTHQKVIRLSLPLNIRRVDIDWALVRIEKVFKPIGRR